MSALLLGFVGCLRTVPPTRGVRALRAAAEYLGVHNRKAQYLFPDGLARWLGQHGTEGFSVALCDIAARLDTAARPVNYQRRREALQQW